MSYYVNPFIKDTLRVFPMQGRYDFLRYDMNENPEGLPENFVNEVLAEITPEFLATYPEQDIFLRKYAKFVDVNFNNVLATNGSDMAIRYILETFGEVGKDVVTVSPSFEMYAVNCSILGYKHKPVVYEQDLSINIDNIVNAVNEDTRIVVLLNPNNPIGNVYSSGEAERIIRRAKECGAVVIIDEAYHYFYDKTFLDLVFKYDNVIILRTFSKLFSIAACRIGIIISNPDIISFIKKARLTFDVNSIALLFAERIIDNTEVIERLIQEEKDGKKFILSKLKGKGYECRDCRGNFIFVKPRKQAREVVIQLKKKKKILVHGYSNELLRDYIRVSVGSKRAMEIFFNAFMEIDND